jgi:DNA-binding NarL/FixJ family response regulator
VIADMRVGDGNSEGVESISTLSAKLQHTPVIVISDHCSRSFISRLLNAGAKAVVPKSAGIDGLVDAIKQAVAAGTRPTDRSRTAA